MKSSQLIWRLLHSVKLTVKISSIFVAFLENMNFKKSATSIAIIIKVMDIVMMSTT